MKKKIAVCLVMSCMTVGLWGCSAKLPAVSSQIKEEVQKEDTEGEKGADSKKEEDKDGENSRAKASDGPVLGQEDIDGYDGFVYLYDEILRTDSEENKETGKMEKKQMTVYIPRADYASVNRNYASSTVLGVTVRVELEPYIRYNSQDYLATENLQHYIEETYDPFYTSNYKDLVISEVEEISKNSARTTVEYCEYNSWEDDYTTVFSTYYMVELGDKTVLVIVDVSEDGITGKTPELLAELEAFYQFEINWDKDRAEKKRTDYMASGGDNTYSTGYLLFELPENWAHDKEISDYKNNVYAPEGDVAFSGCGIFMTEDYVSYGEASGVDDFIRSTEEAKEYLAEMMGSSITISEIEKYETCLGTSAKFSYTISEGGNEIESELYYIPSDYYIYMIYAVKTPDAIEDPFAVASDILENGRTR